MSIARRLLDLFEGLSLRDVENLRPVDRERLAQICEHWAAVARGKEPEKGQRIFADAKRALDRLNSPAPRRRASGVLAALDDGHPRHE
jgi:hypothetical protein